MLLEMVFNDKQNREKNRQGIYKIEAKPNKSEHAKAIMREKDDEEYGAFPTNRQMA